MPIPIMRRHERQLTPQQTLEVLQNGNFGVLSTVDSEGQPYGVPLNYVFHENAIYFHCAPDGYKLLNLAQQPRVSFCVVAQSDLIPEHFSTDYVSAIVFGTAYIIEGQEKLDALYLLIQHLSPGHITRGEEYIARDGAKATVVKIDVDLMTGKGRK